MNVRSYTTEAASTSHRYWVKLFHATLVPLPVVVSDRSTSEERDTATMSTARSPDTILFFSSEHFPSAALIV